MAKRKRGDRKARKDGSKPSGRPQRKSKRGPADLLDCELMKALTKPQRVRAYAILAERMASPSEISAETGEDIATVSYHVKVLCDHGLVVLDHTEPRRGAVEHFYRAVSRTIFPAAAWDNLPPSLKKEVSVCILREFFDDASNAMEAGIFDDPASKLSWTPLILDELGLEEVGQLAGDFLTAVFEVQTKANERLAATGRSTPKRISATVFLANFLSARSPKDGKKASATKRR